ncbi:MAG: DUF2784 family protein [Stellaceae bacterium]
MAPNILATLAVAVLAVHVAAIAFNVFGLVAIPLGAWRGWAFVRGFWWRAVHLALLFVVALQALFGRACFLTLWQAALEQNAGQAASREPLIARWVDSVIFWNLPIGFFAALYVAVLITALALWRWVPPARRPTA